MQYKLFQCSLFYFKIFKAVINFKIVKYIKGFYV